MAEKSYIGAAPYTLVRTVTGSVIGVHRGASVPAEADPDDVARLVAESYLAEDGVEVSVPVGDPTDTNTGEGGTLDDDGDKPTSIKAILADVDGDPVKAQAALDAELATDAPRVTLVSKLEAIVGGDAS